MWAWCHVIGESDPCVNDLCTNCLYHTPRSLNGLWQTYWPWDLDPVNYVIKIYISCDYKISPNAKWVQNRNPMSLKLKSKCHPETFSTLVQPIKGLHGKMSENGAKNVRIYPWCKNTDMIEHFRIENSEFLSVITVFLHHGSILTFWTQFLTFLYTKSRILNKSWYFWINLGAG